MFFQHSAGRTALRAWLGQLLPLLRADNADARLLDEVTASEILDLTYLQGSPFETAIAANAVFPGYLEQFERMPAPSEMGVTFDVNVESEDIGVDIELRFGHGSELKIGQGGVTRVTNPRYPVPASLRSPVVEGTEYHLSEADGDGLRSLAGPLTFVEQRRSVHFDRALGEQRIQVAAQARQVVYGTIDRNDRENIPRATNGELLGRETNLDDLCQYRTYLWSDHRSIQADVLVSWKRINASRLSLSISLKNETPEPDDFEARDADLAAMILPHLTISVHGGTPDFPPLQYAEAKRRFYDVIDSDERWAEAARRLYAVRQTGCVATRAADDEHSVVLSTFGLFDTPREPPVPGPTIEEVVGTAEGFLAQCPNVSEPLTEWVVNEWTLIRSALLAAGEAFGFERLHRFQWEGIVANCRFLAENRTRIVTVVRAPTGAGKTVVFFVNALIAALSGSDRSTSLLMFPTRLLNEDMFRRLIAFVSCFRLHRPDLAATGGILMGTNDPLYRLLLQPDAGEAMYHYGGCPRCGASGLIATVVGTRVVASCRVCEHVVDYMYNPREIGSYLPDIVIATPDKLFYEATATNFDPASIGLFGAPVRRCDRCGRAFPDAYLTLKGAWGQCADAPPRGGDCGGSFRGPATPKLVRYMGFDEVHSLYGETATYLSVFLSNLEVMQAVLSRQRDIPPIRYETATATISNEIDLLEAITRRKAADGEIIHIPAEDEVEDYFQIAPNTVRHRTLATLPTRMSSRECFIRSVLNSYLHLRGPAGDLEVLLREHTPRSDDWSFLLGYLFKKQEGTDMQRALRDMYRNTFGRDLRLDFLSGEAPKNQISRIIQRTLAGELDLLLANLVISLGVDIQGLNHMVMLAVPRSFTEFVQTAGRTGRGESPGHVQVILRPFYARDSYFFRHFHAVLSDVAGYYDVLPVRSTNLFCADGIFGNVAKSLLTALCLRLGDPTWPHANGVRGVARTMGQRLDGAISRVLCDDLDLADEIADLVRIRKGQLLDELARHQGFLAQMMRESDVQWLLWSLRSRTGSNVRIACVDEQMLELLRPDRGGDTDEQLEPLNDDAS